MQANNFQASLEVGKAGESAIACWLQRRGWSVLPVYEKIIDEGKGPQLFSASGNLVAPDLLVLKAGNAGNQIFWIEAKHKNAFPWHRITQQWTTGIDRRHYRDYLAVAKQTGVPTWLFFLHRGGIAKDSPPSPAGLYGNTIDYLATAISHESDRWGTSGMVYWGIGSLVKIAEYYDVVYPQH